MTMNPAQIELSARIAALLRARLASEFNLAEDDEAIDDTVSGECDLPELLAQLARDATRAEAYAKAIAELIKGEQSRKARLEAKADKLRSLIALGLQEAGYRKLPLPDGATLTMSNGKRPLIVDEGADMPEAYIRIKREPDKPMIRAALEGGTELAFARFGNSEPVLTIRRS